MKVTRPKQAIAAAVIGIVAIVACVWSVLWFTPLVTVKHVEVQGVVHGDAKAIEAASGITAGQKMLRVNTKQAAQNIASEPWVHVISVGRTWPSTVTISVTEYEPVLFMRATDGDHLFDGEGHEFTTAPPPPGTVELIGAPRVDNPEDGKLDLQPEVLKSVLAILNQLPAPVREGLAQVAAPKANEVKLLFHDGHELFVGSSDNAREKGRAAELVLKREERIWNISNPHMPTAQQ